MKKMKAVKTTKKWLACLLSLAMLVGVTPSIVLADGWQAATEANVVRIGAFSDSHVADANGAKWLTAALDAFKAVDENYAGLAMVGDIVIQQGQKSDNYTVKEEPYNVVNGVLAEHAKDKPYMWAMGNHEFPLACVIKTAQSEEQKTLMQTAVQNSKTIYTQKTGMSLNNDVTIGGYHFITAAPIDFSNAVDAEGEAYLRQQIDAAITADGENKPIFLTLHHAPWYTTVSSTETVYDQPFSDDFINYLKTKHNVIVLHGHNHRSEHDPRTIWQDGFTVVNLGQTSNGGGAVVDGSVVLNREVSEGVMLEIKDNVVTIKRMDFKNQCYIGEDRVLDIPNMNTYCDKTNANYETYWKYTDARSNKTTAPIFSADTEITTSRITESTATISFKQATVENSPVEDTVIKYNVKIVNKKLNALLQNYDVASDFYRPEALRAEKIDIPLKELSFGTEYTVTVKAITAYGKTSNEISGTFKTAAYDNTKNTATSPESETREVVYKYVAKDDGTGSYTTAYDEINSPGRNRKEVTADDDGNYPEGSFTATVDGEEKHFVNWFHRDTRFGFGGHFVDLYEQNNYITFSLDVEKSGVYELMGIAANSTSSDMGVYIDGSKKGTFTVPVNNSGSYGPIYDATYTGIGEYVLTAGTHAVTLKLEKQANASIQFWGVALALEKEAQVINKHYTEGAIKYSGHGHEEAANDLCRLYGDGYGIIEFTVEVPVNGEYVLSAEASGSDQDSTFAVAVNGTNETVINLPKGDLTTIASLTAEKTVSLAKGENTITLTAATDKGAPYLRSITLISYDTTDRWGIYPIDGDNVTSWASGNAGDTPNGGSLIMMPTVGHATYKITPAKTGRYNLSWEIYKHNCYGQSFVKYDGVEKALTEKTHYSDGERAYTEPIEVTLMEGYEYEFTFKAVEAFDENINDPYFTLYNMKLEYTGEPKNGGEGVYYDIFAGDKTAFNSTGTDYGDGKGKNDGLGMYGSIYADFTANVDYEGWYDINMVLGASTDTSSVQLLIDEQEVATKNAVNSTTWTTRADNNFGKIYLTAGKHSIRVLGKGGEFMFFKVRLAFDRVDDGASAISFAYAATDFNSKGGSNVVIDYTNNGVVLGEGNSYTEYVVDVPEGNYIFAIAYGTDLEGGGRTSLTINGAALGTYSLAKNGTWIGRNTFDANNYTNIEVVNLNEGINKIKLRCETFANSGSYGYFSFSGFKLIRITEPVVQMFKGEYASTDRLYNLTDGTLTVRMFLPNSLKSKPITMVAAIYKDDALYKAAVVSKDAVSAGDTIYTKFENVQLESGSNYTYKFIFLKSVESMIPYFNASTTLN